MADAKNIKLAPLVGEWLALDPGDYAWTDADSRAEGMSEAFAGHMGGLYSEQRQFFKARWDEWCRFAPITEILFQECLEVALQEDSEVSPPRTLMYVDPAVPGECFSEDVFAELSLELSDLM